MPGRKKGTACARCRSQKIRCDDERPACSNCARSGHSCVRPNLADHPDVASHVAKMEARLRSLEASLRRVAPDELSRLSGDGDGEGSGSSAEIQPLDNAQQQQPPPPPPPPVTAAHPQARAQAQASVEDDLEDQEDTAIVNDDAITIHPHPRPQAATTPSTTYPGHGHVSTDSPALTSASPAVSSQIGPGEPLAHEVGMLSLANSRESKYIGPSSGVPFARLIFSAVPQSQGLSTAHWSPPSSTGLEASGSRRAQVPQAAAFSPGWTPEIDLQLLADAYFETLHPVYPFLDEDSVSDLIEHLHTGTSEASSLLPPLHSVQLFLVLALGARTLEVRLSTDFAADRYLATAMQRVGGLALHDSVPGLQIMLLLALSSFYFEQGPNAWFLVANIIASCQDLGLQRRCPPSLDPGLAADEGRRAAIRDNLRRGIFWSAYSLERTLAVVMGRPLTLRDEAIDAEFPASVDTTHKSDASSDHPEYPSPQSSRASNKRPRMTVDPFAAARYSFSFDQITAEIKLMLYRVVNLPTTFPWPTTNLDVWQAQVHARCDALLDALRPELRRASPRRSSSGPTIRTLELKYHHCLMLLYRPSPAITRPTLESWRACYNSAVETIRISSDLHRLSRLSNSWLTAHTVFVSGITFLYCLWVRPEIQRDTSLGAFTGNAAACTLLLKYLAGTWSVAADAVVKFDKLVHLTAECWREPADAVPPEVAAGNSLLSMLQAPPPGHVQDGGDATPRMYDGFEGSTDMVDYYGGAGGLRADFNLEPENFFTELGDVSGWFDLNWLVDMQS